MGHPHTAQQGSAGPQTRRVPATRRAGAAGRCTIATSKLVCDYRRLASSSIQCVGGCPHSGLKHQTWPLFNRNPFAVPRGHECQVHTPSHSAAYCANPMHANKWFLPGLRCSPAKCPQCEPLFSRPRALPACSVCREALPAPHVLLLLQKQACQVCSLLLAPSVQHSKLCPMGCALDPAWMPRRVLLRVTAAAAPAYGPAGPQSSPTQPTRSVSPMRLLHCRGQNNAGTWP